MESKDRVAQLHRVTIAQRRFCDALAAKPTPVLAPQITQHEGAIASLDVRMMARDGAVVHYDIIVERPPDLGSRARLHVKPRSIGRQEAGARASPRRLDGRLRYCSSRATGADAIVDPNRRRAGPKPRGPRCG